MILPIIKYGSPILRKKAFDIDKGVDFKELAANMFLTLKMEKGIGLAGPQVSILKNVFIIDTMPLQEDGIVLIEKIYINPEIINYNSDTAIFKEGCLSLPGINEDVLRPDKIEVRYRNENFDLCEEVLIGVVARVFQHEFDHLQGILFINRLNPLRKKLIKSKLRDIKKHSISRL